MEIYHVDGIQQLLSGKLINKVEPTNGADLNRALEKYAYKIEASIFCRSPGSSVG